MEGKSENFVDAALTGTNLSKDDIKREIMKITMGLSSAWVSGSVFEGIGNKSSDIDVYLVIDNLNSVPDCVTSNRHCAIRVVYVEDRRIDLEYWSSESVYRLSDKLKDFSNISEEENTTDYFDECEIDFLHRLFHSYPLYGDNFYLDLKSKFDFDDFKRYLLKNKQIYLDDAVDDSLGMLESGYYKSSALRAQQSLGFALDLQLIVDGFTNPKEKHRVRQLELRSFSSEFYLDLLDRYWSVMRHLPEGEKEQKDYVRDVLLLSESVATLALDKNRCPI